MWISCGLQHSVYNIHDGHLPSLFSRIIDDSLMWRYDGFPRQALSTRKRSLNMVMEVNGMKFPCYIVLPHRATVQCFTYLPSDTCRFVLDHLRVVSRDNDHQGACTRFNFCGIDIAGFNYITSFLRIRATEEVSDSSLAHVGE